MASYSTAIGLVLVAILIVFRLADAARFINSAIAAIHYPFELDFGEGVVLNQTTLLMTGRMYGPVGAEPPYVISNYPPVFHFFVGILSLLTGNMLATGRALSVLSALLSALIIGVLVWRAVRPEVRRLPRGLSAAMAGLSFLSVSYVASWAPLMRVDLLAESLALGGVLLFVAGVTRGRRVYWSALPFLLAVYTKQTAIAASAACVGAALLLNPRVSMRLAGLLIAAGVGAFAVLNWLTGGQFYIQTVAANANTYDWHRTVFFLSDLKDRYAVECAIATIGAVSLWRGLWPLRGSVRNRQSWTRAVLGTYLFTTFIVSLTVGKIGSEVNYLIEFMGAVCVCVGVAVADGFAPEGTTSAGAHSSLSALFIPALLLLGTAGFPKRAAIEWLEIPPPEREREMARLVELVRNVDGPVLSEDLTLLLLAGKPVEFQPCDMAHMVYQRLWDASGFVRRLEQQDYRLIVLKGDLNDSAPRDDSFSPPMIAAIRNAYVPAGALADYRMYRPR